MFLRLETRHGLVSKRLYETEALSRMPAYSIELHYLHSVLLCWKPLWAAEIVALVEYLQQFVEVQLLLFL